MAAAEEGSQGSGGKGKLLTLVILLAAAGGGVGLGFAATKQPKHEEPAAPTTLVYELPELIVNLAETRGQRYLKLRMALKLRATGKEPPSAAIKNFDERNPEMRDGLIRLLSAKSFESIESSDAKQRLKLEVLSVINDVVLEGSAAKAERLFFLEFLVQ